MKKIICLYHSADLDGWMSAAIVKLWYEKNYPNGVCYSNPYKGDGSVIANKEDEESLTFFGFNHGDEIPSVKTYDTIIMCDIIFNPLVMVVYNTTKNFIWCDHHISSIEKMEGIVIKGLRDTNFAACELTWKYFFSNEQMPEIVRLLGRYDCFGHKGTHEEEKIIEFQYGARQCISNYEEAYKYLKRNIDEMFRSDKNVILEVLCKGKPIYQYLCIEAKQSYKNGFVITFDNPNYIKRGIGGSMIMDSDNKKVNFICINKERFNPINFNIDYHNDGYDGVAAFYNDGKNWNFSIYSDGITVDCSKIAETFKGGGHKGASGFIIKDINEFFKQYKN